MARTPAGVPEPVTPILATDGELPRDEGWAYEYKWDGYRCCLRVGPDGEVRLTSRSGHDLTETYPELTGPPGPALAGRAAVLDGEIVALDAAGRPDFGLLQRRHQRRPTPTMLERFPVNYIAFDLLLLDDHRLLDQPYLRRRERLAELAARDPEGGLAVPPHYTRADAEPDELLSVVREHGLEGLIAKRLDSPYRPGRRTRLWIKRALFSTQEAVVGGWQPGHGHRADSIGSLLLGAHDERGRLRYIGHVGSGFSRPVLADLLRRLTELTRPASPFANPVPAPQARRARWVEPRLVVEVAHRTWTREGRLRHPVWRGLRPDRRADEVALPAAVR